MVTFPIRRTSGGQSPGAVEMYLDSLKAFADSLKEIQSTLDFHMGARDWCYLLESYGLSKGDFDWGQEQIKKARMAGFIAPGFILEEEGHVVEEQYDIDRSPEYYFQTELEKYEEAETTFRDSWMEYRWVSFWKDQDVYIQLSVEKTGLKSLFRNICDKYRIPMCNTRGWGSMEQRAVMAEDFKKKEEEGKTPVLLVCGDFDPAGLCITDTTKQRFEEYKTFTGWDPVNLIVDRFGLNYDFIMENGLSWIDGLTTGSGQDMGNEKHRFWRDNVYDVQSYVEKYGKKKCEANAVIAQPELGRQLLVDAIEKYVGEGAYDDFLEKVYQGREEVRALIEEGIQAGE